MKESNLSLTSFQLKCIALISMCIDHYAIIWRSCLSLPCYRALRGIGRMAFPLYAFLLVEGFFYTKSREKYLIRLLLFTLVSEIPFDICLHHGLTDQISGVLVPNYQNIFFTLFIGYLAMMYLARSRSPWEHLSILIVSCTIAELLSVDYGAAGVLTILLFYYRRKDADLQEDKAWFCIPLLPLIIIAYRKWIQLFCVLALFPLGLYNGRKGKNVKYFFYIMYPLHMILFYLIKEYMYR